MTQIKQHPGNDSSYVSAAILVKKEESGLHTLDAFDTGAETTDDTAIGGLVGALFGVLGGSYGLMVGSILDTDDALMNSSLLEQITKKLENNEVAIIALAYEQDEAILDQKFSGFKTIVARFDAAAVAAEVEEAQEMEIEMARLARKELRDEKKAEQKEKRAEKKAKLSADWEALKAKFKKADDENAQ